MDRYKYKASAYKSICRHNQALYELIGSLIAERAALEFDLLVHNKLSKHKKRMVIQSLNKHIKQKQRILAINIDKMLGYLTPVKWKVRKQPILKPPVKITDYHPVILSFNWNEDNSVATIARKQGLSEDQVKEIIYLYENKKV